MSIVKNFQILVVDDEDASRYTTTRVLRRAGYQVMEATSGKQALAEIEKHPDLIIMDVQLPDMNGLDVSRAVRHNPNTRSIPILQVSATFTASADKVKGLDAGADGYLASPIEPDELLANVRMLLRLKQAQEDLSRTNERLESVLSNIVDVYLALDFDWHILELNPAAERFFQKAASTLRGKKFWEEFPDSKRASFFSHLEEVMAGKPAVHFEAESTIRPGTWWEGHAYRRKDRIELYLRDISERKNSEQKLAEFAGKLQSQIQEQEFAQAKLAEAKNLLSLQNQKLEARVSERTAQLQSKINDLETFSYSVSHDMRAPLRAMQGFSELLLQCHSDKLNAEGRDFLHRIANSAYRLDVLIRDVLSYSNIIRENVACEPVDTDKLIRNLIAEYPEFQEPRATIHWQNQLPAVLGNQAFLAQCFSNLLGNAVKFVAPGIKPAIEISVEKHDGKWRFKIRDNGIGIASQYHHKLFILFSRVHTSYDGTGIGLAIIRKAVERMGGSVGFESESGQGSTFWLDLKPAK